MKETMYNGDDIWGRRFEKFRRMAKGAKMEMELTVALFSALVVFLLALAVFW